MNLVAKFGRRAAGCDVHERADRARERAATQPHRATDQLPRESGRPGALVQVRARREQRLEGLWCERRGALSPSHVDPPLYG